MRLSGPVCGDRPTEASLEPLSKCAKAHPEVARLAKAFDDLKKRLGK